MNKKLFIKRLGISLLWVLTPFVGTGLLVYAVSWFISLVGTNAFIALCLAMWAMLLTYTFYWRDIVKYWNMWTNWLKGNDGQPD